MNTLISVYLIGSSIALIFLVYLVLSQSSAISSMKESMSNMRDKWAYIDGRVAKIEKAVDWFLYRKGLKLERHPASYEWTIMPTNSPEYELYDWWKQIYRHREEIVYALYEANKRALEDHDKDKNKGNEVIK